MSVTTYNTGIAIVSIPASIGTTPANGATLPWNGLNKSYQWTTTLTITVQPQSNNPPTSRQKFVYNGQDINVGMWVVQLSTGLTWQIVSISAKSTTSVSCTLQDINRYNTYRDPTKTGNGKPGIGAYVVFNISDAGNPMIDPAPAGVGINFYTTLTGRFQYVNKQYDIALSQPGNASVTFLYGDILAIDESTQTYVLVDSTHTSTIVGSVTSVDDSQTVFTINPIGKITDNLNSLPGQVGSFIYSDNSNPGGITTTSGGALLYLQLRNNTQSIALSNTFASTTTSYTTVGYTFNVNGVLATIGGTGILLDVVNAINGTSGSSGVSAVISGSGPYYITSTAIDARQIGFEDIAGSVILDIGLTSVENGIKAIGMYVSGSSSSVVPAGLTQSFGYIYVQSTPMTTWIITHNAGTTNVSAQVYDNTTGTAASGNTILPDEIAIIDINNIQVTFQAAQAGTALLNILL